MRMIPILAAGAALSVASAAMAAGFADPAAIDAQVAQFTGAAIGEPGGARLPVDRRLKLSHCAEPLALEFYGRTRGTVRVSCPVPGGWRIFVPLTVQAAAVAAAPAEPVVARGESVSIAVHGHGFTLSRQGEALESGAVGEWIRVQPAGSKTDPMRARVLRPGAVGMDLP